MSLKDYTDEQIAAEHYKRQNAGTCKWCKQPFAKHKFGKCPEQVK